MSTKMSTKQERDEFEAAYCRRYPVSVGARKFDLDDNDEYADGTMWVAFDMWRVARQPLPTCQHLTAAMEAIEALTKLPSDVQGQTVVEAISHIARKTLDKLQGESK